MASRKPVHLAAFLLGSAALLFGIFVPRAHIPLIPCAFRYVTGYPCPFCGTTRAFLAAGHGAWGQGLRESPLGALLFPGAVVLAIWGAWGLWLGRKGDAGNLHARAVPRWVWPSVGVLVLVNWLYRLGCGLK